MKYLLAKIQTQSKLSLFLHAQVVIFWILILLVSFWLRILGVEDRRLLLASYPLLQTAIVVLCIRPTRINAEHILLVLIVYGAHLLILFNPQEIGWIRHIILLQMYFSLVAVFANARLNP